MDGIVMTETLVKMLINRLENVRAYGRGWRATCPVHGGKSQNSLSIAEGDDGRVLLHCFGGCDPLEVVKACGLEASDLFPKRLTHYVTLEQRNELRRQALQSQWQAARSTLQFEARIVWVAGGQIKNGEPLNNMDSSRLDLALARITESGRMLDAR
jgi:hypothetical protein